MSRGASTVTRRPFRLSRKAKSAPAPALTASMTSSTLGTGSQVTRLPESVRLGSGGGLLSWDAASRLSARRRRRSSFFEGISIRLGEDDAPFARVSAHDTPALLLGGTFRQAADRDFESVLE